MWRLECRDYKNRQRLDKMVDLRDGGMYVNKGLLAARISFRFLYAGAKTQKRSS